MFLLLLTTVLLVGCGLSDSTELGSAEGESEEGDGQPPIYYGPRRSVAVLAPEIIATAGNSEDLEPWLGDALALELQDRLARASNLQVAGRFSTAFLERNKAPPEAIAQRLRVAHLLVGELTANRAGGDVLRIPQAHADK